MKLKQKDVPTIILLRSSMPLKKSQSKLYYKFDNDVASKFINMTGAIGLWSAKVIKRSYYGIITVKVGDSEAKSYSTMTYPNLTVSEMVTNINGLFRADGINITLTYDSHQYKLKFDSFDAVNSIQIVLNEDFVKFLNQPVGDFDKTIPANGDYIIDGVWNRDVLYLHSSISTDGYGYVTDMPLQSTTYVPRYTHDRIEFSLWFTNDGMSNIVDILHENIIVELWVTALKSKSSGQTP